jgi:hypothetical protein
MNSSFSAAEYLLNGRPQPRSCFFKQPQPERLFGGDHFEGTCLVAKHLDLVGGGGAGRVASQAALAGFKEFLGPSLVKALGDGLVAAQGRDALLAAQPFEDDADLVLGRVVLTGVTANVTHYIFGGRLGGGGGGFLAHLHSPGGYDEPEILRYSTTPFRLMGADAEHGLELHEPPMMRPGEQTLLQPGMVINIEPMLRDSATGLLMHTEDLVEVTETGARVLTLGLAPDEIPFIGQAC